MKKMIYTAPTAVMMEVRVERGFAASAPSSPTQLEPELEQVTQGQNLSRYC